MLKIRKSKKKGAKKKSIASLGRGEKRGQRAKAPSKEGKGGSKAKAIGMATPRFLRGRSVSWTLPKANKRQRGGPPLIGTRPPCGARPRPALHPAPSPEVASRNRKGRGTGPIGAPGHHTAFVAILFSRPPAALASGAAGGLLKGRCL